jgi:hypothetical protein
MSASSRSRRAAVWMWIGIAVVVWNGLYDLLLNRAAKDYLFRAALHDAGRGPSVSLSEMMHIAVRDAALISTLWAGIILLAGLWTIRRGTGALRGQVP